MPSRPETVRRILRLHPGPEAMSAVAFDTLKFAQNLRDKANFSPAQAEGVSQAFSEAITDQLATRGDLADLATKDDIADVGRKWAPSGFR